jgi:tetratricopeptide (TPR) repeat protein
MVDTLRQRLRGRGPALQSALDRLLREHYWVYCGFSGADLDFDPDYLGLRAAAEESPGFTFVHLPGSTPRPSVQALRKRYGEKGQFVGATLSAWFGGLLDALGVEPPPPPPVELDDPRNQVVRAVQAWAQGLHAMEAINVLSALLEASGQEWVALWLLHRTWESARLPRDTSGPAYSRFLFNYGRLALVSGETRYEETPQNFLRSREDLPEANLGAALFFTYVGNVEYTRSFLREAAGCVDADNPPPSFAGDFALAFSQYADIYGEQERALQYISWALEIVTTDGDLPRQGRLRAAAALIWARGEQGDRAAEECDLAERVAGRLGDEVLRGQVLLARGVMLVDRQGSLSRATEHFRQAAEIFEAYHRVPLLLPTYLEWTKAAWLTGDEEAVKAAHGRAFALLQYLPVYQVRFHYVIGRLYALSQSFADARKSLLVARDVAIDGGNNWMVGVIGQALHELK